MVFLLFNIAITIILPCLLIAILIQLETYHTVRMPILILALTWGMISFTLSREIEQLIVALTTVDTFTLTVLIAPIFEEGIRSVAIIVMYVFVLTRYSGDAMIYGFAVGSGFAIMENILYIFRSLFTLYVATGTLLPSHVLGNALLRILSTGLLHAGIAAVVASIVNGIVYYRSWGAFGFSLILMLGAIMMHSAYNTIFWLSNDDISFLVGIIIGLSIIVTLVGLLNYNLRHEYNQIIEELHYDPERILSHKTQNGTPLLDHIHQQHGKKQKKLVEKYLIKHGQIAVYTEHLDNANYRPRAIRSLRRAIAADLRRARRIFARMTPELQQELKQIGIINAVSLTHIK